MAKARVKKKGHKNNADDINNHDISVFGDYDNYKYYSELLSKNTPRSGDQTNPGFYHKSFKYYSSTIKAQILEEARKKDRNGSGASKPYIPPPDYDDTGSDDRYFLQQHNYDDPGSYGHYSSSPQPDYSDSDGYERHFLSQPDYDDTESYSRHSLSQPDYDYTGNQSHPFIPRPYYNKSESYVKSPSYKENRFNTNYDMSYAPQEDYSAQTKHVRPKSKKYKNKRMI